MSKKRETMQPLLLLILVTSSLFSIVHYAKVEPYESRTLKSAVSGLVVEANLSLEGQMIESGCVIAIDDRLDRIDLNSSYRSKALLEEMLKINQELATTLKDTLKRQEGYYQRLNRLSTASKTQKDNAYNAFSSAKAQYLGTREKIINLEKQIVDLNYKIEALNDTIAKKRICIEDHYIYKMLISKGDFVNPSTPLLEVKDLSRAKLVLFLDEEELKDIEHKILYINGEKTEYKVDKVWKLSDTKYISSYRTEVIIKRPKERFSSLLKVEIK
jgi:multidrug resistance efflux pump